MSKIKYDPKTMSLNFINESDENLGLINLKNDFDKSDDGTTVDRYRLEVSLVCDLSCQYCVVHMNKVSQQGKVMSMEIAQNIVKQFNEEIGEKGSLFLMGGEPLTNWQVVKYIISNCKGQTLIFSNAYKLDTEKATFLRDNNTLILTSLDGYTLEHNKARFYPKVEQRFDIVTNNIKNAIELGCKVGIGCVVHQDNVADLKNIVEYFTQELKASSFSFAYPHFTTEESFTNEFSIEDYTKQICGLLDVSKQKQVYIDQIGKVIGSLLNRRRTISSCKAGLSQKTFYPDGRETHCTKLDTLKDYSLDSFIDNLPRKNPSCQECIALNICGGGCPWDAAVFPNEVGVDKRICTYMKTLVNYILEDINKSISSASTLEEAKKIIMDTYVPITAPK